jgi:flagellar biogenesis protein FliO
MSRIFAFDHGWGWSALPVACALATPVWAQKLGQGGGVEIAWWRVAGALILCLTLGVAGAFALRVRLRAAGQAPSLKGMQAWVALAGALRPAITPLQRQPRRLKLIETVRLSHQADVCLLECDGRDFLVAVTSQGVLVLNADEAPTGPASR